MIKRVVRNISFEQGPLKGKGRNITASVFGSQRDFQRNYPNGRRHHDEKIPYFYRFNPG
jgi:hypothetical protein